MNSQNLKQQIATQQDRINEIAAQLDFAKGALNSANNVLNFEWSTQHLQESCNSWTGKTCPAFGIKTTQLFRANDGSYGDGNMPYVPGWGSGEQAWQQAVKKQINENAVPPVVNAKNALAAITNDLTDAKKTLADLNAQLIKQLAAEGSHAQAAGEWWKQNRLMVIAIAAIVIIAFLYFKFK